MPQINARLKTKTIDLYTFTPVDISGLPDQPAFSFALEAVDQDGRRIYVRMSPAQIRLVHRRMGDLLQQGWFIRKIQDFQARVSQIIKREEHAAQKEAAALPD